MFRKYILKLLIIANVYWLISCQPAIPEEEKLAKKYCSSCHLFPSPDLLDKQTWKSSVLPEMKFRMGMDHAKLWNQSPDEIDQIIQALPSKAMLTEDEWVLIQNYYEKNAPDSLMPNIEIPTTVLDQFSVENYHTSSPYLTLVEHNPGNGQTMIGSRFAWLYRMDHEFNGIDSLRLPSPASDLVLINPDSMLVLAMGIMDPNDQPKGKLISLNFRTKQSKALIDSLKRPVHFEVMDMDDDGDQDILVSCYGNFTGALLLFEKTRAGFTKHVIHTLPGTRKTIARDFNQDGLVDVMALIAQGNEHLSIFYNKGKLQFREEVLKSFSPVYGSSYFDLKDFNRDGFDDIIYCNGDNADYSQVIKPYHGIRILLNDGKYHFTESVFIPMPGASQVTAEDFDLDGDMDLAAISFFPDYRKTPSYNFSYFKNNGTDFSQCISTDSEAGRWLRMETTDLDNDQDIDVILVALNFDQGVPKTLWNRWKTKPVSIQVLRNTKR